MNSSEDNISHWFANHMEHTAMAGSLAAPLIPAAADLIVQTLLNDGKVLACANGSANTLAQYLCTSLLGRLDQDRPGLPAVNLGADATTYSAICRDNRFNETFARQVTALGKPGDTLMVFVDDGHKANLIQAIQAAHDREINVIVVSAREKTDISTLLQTPDLEITLNDLDPVSATPIMMLITGALCRLVEHNLFGG
ncbi:SIS domain-containing protein [Marinobacter bryozoorum]|uniref:D-sedoheptulose-7-phosphate isomerase n=1 Tax=Marinobacter bryozoorum TaxID=256324 RepID=UPI002002FDB2|nr:SIS domain-containing protein [Marinobacter bryozoorum]MCK7543857.1 SIS domain-containing protein [Marinobacter bryozoorum]